MNREELKNKLDELKVNPLIYSLYGELLSDRMVLYQSCDDWIVFYFDERGNRDNEKIFNSESDSCKYIYKEFEMLKKYGRSV